MFLISVFVCFCIASAINYFKTRNQRTYIKNLKGPFTFPLMGSLHKLMLVTPRNFEKKSNDYVQKFGSFSRCWVFHRLLIPTTDYELVEQLLSSRAHLNTGYNLLKPWLGDGLLMCDAEKWEQRRQLISHEAFQASTLDEFVSVFDEHAKVLNDSLSTVGDGKHTFDISAYISKAVLDIIVATTLGVKGLAQCGSGTEYANTVTALTHHFTERFLRLSSANNATYTVICPLQKRRQRRLIKTINTINKEIINNRRYSSTCWLANSKESKSGGDIYAIQINAHEQSNTPIYHITLLDTLLDAKIGGTPLNDAEISNELNTFICQGYLLATSALSFVMIMLARHPRVQQKVYEELEQFWPNYNSKTDTCSVKTLNRLTYMENVIRETLRLYPVLPIIGRQLKEPFQYTHSQVGNGTLPIGSEIYINLFDMLRNEAKFKDPQHFVPERFADESTSATNLLSFSMGPRDCIAQKFALLLMKTVLVHVLSEYEILPFGDEVRLEFKIVLKSTNGFQLGLQKRKT